MSSKPKAKTRQENIQLLNEFEDTPNASRNILISTVKQMYSRGSIRTYKEAETLIKLAQENKMDDFDEKYNKIEAAANIKLAKQQAKVIKQEEAEEKLTITEKNLSRYIVRVKNKKSELPTFELDFKNEYTDFNAAWKSGVLRLIKLAENRLEEKPNIKIVVGVEVIIIKPGQEEEDKEATIHAHTMPESVYSKEGAAPMIRSKKADLQKRLQARIDHQAGSGWAVKKIKSLFLTTYTQTPSRGSSYIPTPEALCNPKLGLINIQNNDNECFKYCLLYHQSEKKKNGERVSALKKLEDKYNWNGVSFPASFNDIATATIFILRKSKAF
jgi:hypothetical protein